MVMYLKNYSLWLDYRNSNYYPKLNRNLDVDVLIVGGGITGVSTAYHLVNSKLKVAVVERNKIGEGVSARTTGKLTYMQGDIYSKLASTYSTDVAKSYYNSQKDAIKLVGKIIKDNNIECDFSRQKSFLFANAEKDIEKLKNEKSLLENFGSNIKEEKLPLNLKNYYSISVSDTAYFHAVKYIKKLASICYSKGIQIYENTNISKMIKHDGYYICYTNGYIIKAKNVVVASHYPFFIFPFLFPLKANVERSYICASLINDNKYLSGINLNKNSISFRYHQDNINIFFIYLDESHNLAYRFNYKDNFNKLKNDNNKINQNIKNIWSNTDILTNDYLPYIGKLNDNLLISTGYNTWGMTNGSIAGKILSDILLNKNNKYEKLFNPKRSMPFINVLNIGKNIFSSIKPFIQNKLFKNKKYYPKNVIFTKRNGKNVAIYIDKYNKEHIVYNTCPHFKCSLVFNEVEKTWDCPCHSSRFTIDGKCINGPSNKDISYKNN